MSTDPEGVGREDEREPQKLSRRAMIGTAAGGAAAAWALPSILTIDAAAAFTCSPLEWAPGDLDGLGNNPVIKPIGSTTVSVAYDTTGLGGTSGSVSSPSNHAEPLGGVQNFMQLDLEIDGTGTVGDYESLIFTFAAPVFSVSFTLLNIDMSPSPGGTDWVDEVRLFGRSGGAPPTGTYVAASFSNVGSAVTTLNNQGTTPNEYDVAFGTGGPVAPLATSTDGNVDVTFASAIDYLEIRYIAAGPGTQPQLIGISNINGCA
jgi:hypothetical protein